MLPALSIVFLGVVPRQFEYMNQLINFHVLHGFPGKRWRNRHPHRAPRDGHHDGRINVAHTLDGNPARHAHAGAGCPPIGQTNNLIACRRKSPCLTNAAHDSNLAAVPAGTASPPLHWPAAALEIISYNKKITCATVHLRAQLASGSSLARAWAGDTTHVRRRTTWRYRGSRRLTTP